MKFLALFALAVHDELAETCLDFTNSTVCIYDGEPTFFHPELITFEANQRVEAVGGCQKNAPWHLSRLLDVNAKNPGYSWDSAGEAVDVYVLDTWVDCEHQQFDDRCRELKRFSEHSTPARPAHGSHVAGLIGSRDFGSAKRVNIKSVPVLDDDGIGDFAQVIKALEFVKRQIQRAKNKRAIINMSLKGPKSQILDRVVRDMESLAVVVIAAGNDNLDACNFSPHGNAVVGATNLQNRMSQFSNFGKCVSILAPGENMISLCPDQKQCWMSGTSMAAPLTAGAIALYWSGRGVFDPQQIWKEFLLNAAKLPNGIKPGTKNLFAHLQPRTQCLVVDCSCGRNVFIGSGGTGNSREDGLVFE